MSDVLFADGSVVSSSQLTVDDESLDQDITQSMLGIVLSINVSDSVDNLTAMLRDDGRGWRHECKVWVVDGNTESNLILENVIIPPPSPSGVDNFSEEIPPAILKTTDGSKLAENFKNQDWSKLDCVWCVVSFIGGSIDRPYISNWWHHSGNYLDPATGGTALGGNALKQVNVSKNRFRSVRRINGTSFLVSSEGDVYLDTTEAGTTRVVEPSLKKLGVDKGGNIQVDVKSPRQLEINWNKPVEGLKSGSTSASQSRENSKIQTQPAKPGNPPARETSRSFIRGNEYDMLLKSTDLQIYCESQDSRTGQFVVLGNDIVNLSQAKKTSGGVETAARIQLDDGKITIQGKDGDVISISSDQIAVASKSGAQVSIIGDKVSVSGSGGVSLAGPVSLGASTTPAIDGVVLGNQFAASLSAFLGFMSPLVATWGKIPGITVPEQTALTAFELAITALIEASTPGKPTSYVSTKVKTV
jgi:hypothetical protein